MISRDGVRDGEMNCALEMFISLTRGRLDNLLGQTLRWPTVVETYTTLLLGWASFLLWD